MQIHAATPHEYIDQIPPDRKAPIQMLRQIITSNLPEGFAETIAYGMIGYVVPHSIYPAGYHCDAKQPLPFMSIASQKNFIAVYHMGVYAINELSDWFTHEYPKHSKARLDMGKSCLRFKKPENIPYTLIGELASKITVNEWIAYYEKNISVRK